ncbi:MAG TPA: zf-HC2 domain-containing protein [Candidatus Competibacter sp.]|nr:zf-HC2 domain-containing protein [Candidatus Competibacter sp.]
MSTTTDDHSVTNHPHDEIEALLPWYANGTLTVAETATVERHLAHCPACRADLEQCRALVTAVQRNEESWQPAPGGFDRLMAEIDRLEAKPTPAKTSSSSLLQRILDWLQATPNPVRWTLALESMAVAALLLIVATPMLRTVPEYETLSSGAEQPATKEPHLRVVFADAATVGEIRQLLRDIDGNIVAGPTALGVYTVALPATDHSDRALAQALANLRARNQVKLAEPIASGGKP